MMRMPTTTRRAQFGPTESDLGSARRRPPTDRRANVAGHRGSSSREVPFIKSAVSEQGRRPACSYPRSLYLCRDNFYLDQEFRTHKLWGTKSIDAGPTPPRNEALAT